MYVYRLVSHQDNGRSMAHIFQSLNDDEAVCYGLRNRTSSLCELYDANRLLASFDSAPQSLGSRRRISATSKHQEFNASAEFC